MAGIYPRIQRKVVDPSAPPRVYLSIFKLWKIPPRYLGWLCMHVTNSQLINMSDRFEASRRLSMSCFDLLRVN